MKRALLLLLITSFISLGVSSCVTVNRGGSYRASSNDYNEDLTVGKVQKEIRKGMSGAEVIQALGQPNVVTSDENGLVTWVYDKIATEANYSETSDALFLFIYGRTNTTSNYSMTQKTLTVVIKLRDDKVESFSYHASKF